MILTPDNKKNCINKIQFYNLISIILNLIIKYSHEDKRMKNSKYNNINTTLTMDHNKSVAYNIQKDLHIFMHVLLYIYS
jgi:hypothetical protein